MAVALAQEGSFGFALQSEKGSFVSPATWLPLMQVGGRRNADSIELRKNYRLLDLADSNDYESRYYSAGEWAEGQVAVPLIPGVLTQLFSWIQDRDCVNEVKKLTDLKVRKATINLVKGEPVGCLLDVAGLKLEQGVTPSPNIPAAPPYVFREATIQIATGGGGLATDVNCERIQLTIDNAVEEVEEGLRLSSSSAPLQLYNLAGVRCVGAFSRDFVDNAVYGDFAGGVEAALSIALARGEATAVISLPRILYAASDLGLPGSHEKRIVEEVDFVGLGSVDGLTPPVSLS